MDERIETLEIALTHVNGAPVTLGSIPSEGLKSFLNVLGALREIVEAIHPQNDFNFVISEGSVSGALEADQSPMSGIVRAIDQGIKSESDNVTIVNNLRIIHNELKPDHRRFRFSHRTVDSSLTDFGEKVRSVERIRKKRGPNKRYSSYVGVATGYLNQIGGTNPEYHFNKGLENHVKISCTTDELKEIQDSVGVYENVSSLVVHSESSQTSESNTPLVHKAILESNSVGPIKHFLESYNAENELVTKLKMMYRRAVDSDREEWRMILKYLLVGFDHSNFHQSEMKTLLVLSKTFKEDPSIGPLRSNLLESYQKLIAKV